MRSSFRQTAWLGQQLRRALRGVRSLLPTLQWHGVLALAGMLLVGVAHAQVNNAEFVSQNVPATMYVGEKYNVSVTVRNSGTTTWTAAEGYRLGSQNPQDGGTWGGRQYLTASVAPGQQYTFNFTVTAPSPIGSYNFQWQMLREGVTWFGATTTNVAINVTLPPPVNGATFVSQNVPTTMTPGKTYAVSVTMKNAGNTVWSGGHKLGSQNPGDNNTWGLGRVFVTTGVIVPNQSYTFNFTVTAPTTPGTYNFQWRMVEEYKEWFGDITPNVKIAVGVTPSAPTITIQRSPTPLTAGASYTLTWSTVNATSVNYACTASGTGYKVNKAVSIAGNETGTALAAWVGYPSTCTWTVTGAGGTITRTETVTTNAASAHNAAFVSQSVPASMTAGQSYPVSVTMSNNGTTTWAANSTIKLGSQNPADNTTWNSTGRVALPTAVAPGQQYVFSFQVTAPASAGSYNFQWRMLDGTTYFGTASTNATVAVSGGSAGTSVTPPAKTLSRVRSYEYDAATGLVTKEIIEPDNVQLRVESSYGYDAWGNQTSQTISSPATGTAAIAARTQSVKYDARGQFPITMTNALSHGSSRAFDPRFGALASFTTPNAQTATTMYDNFGRKSLETAIDGTKTKYTYAYCSGVAGGTTACVGHAKYFMTAQPFAADGVTPNGPWTKTYFNGEDQEVRGETQGFDGTTVIVTEKEYDARGLLLRASLPHYANQAAQWTSYYYDALARLKQSVNAKNATTDYGFNGLTTTVTDALSQTTTYVRDSKGQLVRTTNHLAKALTYKYDGFGSLWQTADPTGNIVGSEYDTLGRKRRAVDPDMGDWTYEYDALGAMVKQTSAKKQSTTYVFDKLGRLTSKTEPDLISTWTFDTCSKGVGKLCNVKADNGYALTTSYDAISRPVTSTTTVDAAYAVTATYDGSGRIATLTYPAGLVIKYVYTSLGYLQEVRDNATNALYWRADSMDAMGHLTQQTYGNGVSTQQIYEPETGLLKNVYAGAGNAVQNLTFEFDKVGNLTTRKDANQSLSETNLYDGLNRLKSSTVNSSGAGIATQSHTYDDIGNIKTRSGVGTYTYGPTNKLPHAVASIALEAGGTRKYDYDANGNLTTQVQTDASGNTVTAQGRTISYTSYDMPLAIAKPGLTLNFMYGAGHQRVKQTGTAGTTIYVHPDAAGGLLYEKETRSDGTVEHRQFISVDGNVIAVVKKVGTAVTTQYFHRDHLQSTAAITNQAGTVIERLAYEPFGKRRLPAGGVDSANTVVGVNSARGFTNHEHLDGVGLVHMNGRVYDPVIGRFVSADPTVPDPSDLQSLNRYSYTRNNPLSVMDPTGYDDIDCTRDQCGPQDAGKKDLDSLPMQRVEISASRTSYGIQLQRVITDSFIMSTYLRNENTSMPVITVVAQERSTSGTPAPCRTSVNCSGNGNNYSKYDPMYHRYNIKTGICQVGTPGCNLNNVTKSLKRNAAPGQLPGRTLHSGAKTAIQVGIFSGGHVTHIVQDDIMRVVNVTDSDHIFYNGLVIRSVVQEGGTIYISSFGEGVNHTNWKWMPDPVSKLINLVLAYPGFQALDRNIQREVLGQSEQGQRILEQQQIRRLEAGNK